MKFRSTNVDAGEFKHALLNRLRSTMAVNVLKSIINLTSTLENFSLIELLGKNVFVYMSVGLKILD